MLIVKGLRVSVNKKPILEDIDLSIDKGELHLMIGPNGAGKSTLLKAIMNMGEFKREGSVIVDDVDLSEAETDHIAKNGVFMSYQHPIEIPGVHMAEFMRNSYNLLNPEDRYDPWSFREYFDEMSEKVGFSEDLGDRDLNHGFSGGEKKRSEILQLLLLKPKYALLDEVDSGLDIDATRKVFELIKEIVHSQQIGILIISHNPNILQYLEPTHVHLLSAGRITASGDGSIVEKIYKKGYTS